MLKNSIKILFLILTFMPFYPSYPISSPDKNLKLHVFQQEITRRTIILEITITNYRLKRTITISSPEIDKSKKRPNIEFVSNESIFIGNIIYYLPDEIFIKENAKIETIGSE